MATDEQISIMCDIAESGGSNLPPEKVAALPVIIADELIERTFPDKVSVGKYRLTAKGQKMLDERGVGANES